MKLVDNYIANIKINSVSLNIKIVYELSNVLKILDRSYFDQNMSKYFLSINLKNLNNQDFITLGFIIKKYNKPQFS